MGLRLFVPLASFVLLSAMPSAIAHDKHPRLDSVVHDVGICWDPDVEFPVPCDDDDD